MTLATFNQRLDRIFQSKRGKVATTWARRIFMTFLIGYLAFQFTEIGWRQILTSLPGTPWFYLLFLINYLSLPLAEVFLYKWSWHFPFWKGIGTFLKKRVLNKDALGYSGEVYLYLWAREHVQVPERELVGVLKDNTIVSSAVSTIFAILVLAVLFFTGQIAFAHALTRHDAAYAVLGALALVGIALLVVRFRRNIFHLSGRRLLVILGVHLVRLTLIHVVQVAQWAVVMPQVPLRAWFSFLTVNIIASRISILPGRDLLSLGVNLQLAQMLDMSEAAVSGMMLAATALDKTTNFLAFSLLSLLNGKKSAASANEPVVKSIEELPEPEPLDRSGSNSLEAQTL